MLFAVTRFKALPDVLLPPQLQSESDPFRRLLLLVLMRREQKARDNANQLN